MSVLNNMKSQKLKVKGFILSLRGRKPENAGTQERGPSLVIRANRTVIGLLIMAIPGFTLAQIKMQSSNFILDNVFIAGDTTLFSSQDNAVPAISSRGPTITLLTATKAVITWETDKQSDSSVEYGTTTEYGLIAGTSEFATKHTVTLSGLSPQTTYHFRVVSTDAFNAKGKSGDNSFTTPAETAVQEFRIDKISYTEAFITVRSGGLKEITLKYGTTASYGTRKTIGTITTATENTFHLTDLTPGTKYYMGIEGLDSNGNKIELLNGLTFTTIAIPRIVNKSVTLVSPNRVTLLIETNTSTTLGVTYASPHDPKPLTAADTLATTKHVIDLVQLNGSAQYSVKLSATDDQGKRVDDTLTFTTPKDTTPPDASDPSINVTRAGNDIILTAKWTTNEPVTSRIEIQSKLTGEKKTIQGPNLLTTSPVIVASGLAPKTPYVLRAISVDTSNNETSKSINFVTPSLKRSILELISQNLSRVTEPIIKLLQLLQR